EGGLFQVFVHPCRPAPPHVTFDEDRPPGGETSIAGPEYVNRPRGRECDARICAWPPPVVRDTMEAAHRDGIVPTPREEVVMAEPTQPVKPPTMEGIEIAPGLWRWTAPHREWPPPKDKPGGWGQMVGCVFYDPSAAVPSPASRRSDDSILLIDPLAPP